MLDPGADADSAMVIRISRNVDKSYHKSVYSTVRHKGVVGNNIQGMKMFPFDESLPNDGLGGLLPRRILGKLFPARCRGINSLQNGEGPTRPTMAVGWRMERRDAMM